MFNDAQNVDSNSLLGFAKSVQYQLTLCQLVDLRLLFYFGYANAGISGHPQGSTPGQPTGNPRA